MRSDGMLRLAPVGEPDIPTVPILERAFGEGAMDGETTLLVLDLTHLRFIDSTGVHALFG